ncbi:hypothetical protein CYLTODRAFT_421574 [Cylindrobasidium torrendii FP15055 ss-10]|uniref:Uncharacterized protein n=1 Tax=Cylindrobasidium torrendii FP15055 ss-10 TaxID=1314674 RepID=A0A0D7BE47_9AGAR|nr:hypothetical protein CYLTODRAFT_421574 [Cylindrobasidium torrendii FP15055 ss-10]
MAIILALPETMFYRYTPTGLCLRRNIFSPTQAFTPWALRSLIDMAFIPSDELSLDDMLALQDYEENQMHGPDEVYWYPESDFKFEEWHRDIWLAGYRMHCEEKLSKAALRRPEPISVIPSSPPGLLLAQEVVSRSQHANAIAKEIICLHHSPSEGRNRSASSFWQWKNKTWTPGGSPLRREYIPAPPPRPKFQSTRRVGQSFGRVSQTTARLTGRKPEDVMEPEICPTRYLEDLLVQLATGWDMNTIDMAEVHRQSIHRVLAAQAVALSEMSECY